MKYTEKHKITLALIFLLALPLAVAAEGTGQERTPIKTGQPEEIALEGMLDMRDGNLILTLEDGKAYLVNAGANPIAVRGRDGSGPAGRREGGIRPDKMPPRSEELMAYAGSSALISGMVLEAPEGKSPFGDISGVIFAKSAVIGGKEIFF